MENNNKLKRKGGHKDNNGLLGKPSNNKGKTREAKLPRRSTLDVEIAANSKEEEEENSDLEENLDHIPVTAHMYRSSFVKQWCSKLQTQIVPEDCILHLMLEHGQECTPCVINLSETPTCHTVDHWRKNVKVKGKNYSVPAVKRPGDRTVRDYHFWMYNSGNFTREQLSRMASPKNAAADKGDNFGGSHLCGGNCLNHARPEANNINQERKVHHKKLREALEKNQISKYVKVRENCKHQPQCFLNPGRLGLTDALKNGNLEAYKGFAAVFL